jgi:hypothetical protein
MKFFATYVQFPETREFLEATDAQIAEWIRLHAFCAKQVNGGRIEAAESLPDKFWHRHGINPDTLFDPSPLWRMEAGDLVLEHFDHEGQRIFLSKSKGGKTRAKQMWGNAESRTPSSSLRNTLDKSDDSPIPSHPVPSHPDPNESFILDGASTTPPSKKFTKPTLEEVTAYGHTLSPPFTAAERFIDHYTANGWRVGKNKTPMNCWKAAIRNWHRDDVAQSPSLNDAEQLKEIVALYPKRERQSEAVEALAAHVRKGTDIDAVAAGTRAIAAIIQRMPGGALNAYVPSAAKFFQNRRWEDDPKTWLRNAGKNGAPIEELYRGGGRQATTIEIQLPPATP